jgi:hypothetical protein
MAYRPIDPAADLATSAYKARRQADALRRKGDTYGAEKLEAWAASCESWAADAERIINLKERKTS